MSEDMKIVIFGIGQYCKNRISNFKKEHIVAFLDNNAEEGMSFCDKSVYKPHCISNMNYDCICLMAGETYANDMYNQLIDYGVNPGKIYRNDRDYFEQKKEKTFEIHSRRDYIQNEVIVFVQHLSNTGSVRAALYLIKALKNDYRGITVIAPCDGVVRNELVKLDVDVVISPDISKSNIELWQMIHQAKFVLLNGLYYGYLVEIVKKELPSAKKMWWLHTGDSFYKTYPIPKSGVNTEGVKVAGVSQLVCEAYRRHNGGDIMVLPFGVPDEWDGCKYQNDDNRIIFAIVGRVIKVKGIDVFFKAIDLLPGKTRNKCEFWIVGLEASPNYSRDLKKQYGHLECVKWLGEKKHEDLMRIFNQIDVLVSSSREDVLSIVAMEAMMHAKPCIISDAVGISEYIEDGISGMIFKNEDAEMLSNMMSLLIGDSGLREEMGIRGRKIFEENFGMDAFRKKLIALIEENKNENISSL